MVNVKKQPFPSCIIGKCLLFIVSGFFLGGCASTKTADEFLDDYCKCVRSAPTADDRKKCEADMVRGMAVQMKDAENNPQNREQTQAMIREATKKLTEMRKSCGGDTAAMIIPAH